jgi:hypothetical protein
MKLVALATAFMAVVPLVVSYEAVQIKHNGDNNAVSAPSSPLKHRLSLTLSFITASALESPIATSTMGLSCRRSHATVVAHTLSSTFCREITCPSDSAVRTSAWMQVQVRRGSLPGTAGSVRLTLHSSCRSSQRHADEGLDVLPWVGKSKVVLHE